MLDVTEIVDANATGQLEAEQVDRGAADAAVPVVAAEATFCDRFPGAVLQRAVLADNGGLEADPAEIAVIDQSAPSVMFSACIAAAPFLRAMNWPLLAPLPNSRPSA